MSNPFTLGHGPAVGKSRYSKIGLSRNPFVPHDEDDQDGPLYEGHLEKNIADVKMWLEESMTNNPPALSIKGSIGVGKTRLMKALRTSVLDYGAQEHVHAALVSLGKAGYARPSIGQLLIDVIDAFVPAWVEDYSFTTGAVPLVDLIANSDTPISSKTLISQALALAQTAQGSERADRVRLISRWLHRESLSAKQSSLVGLYGRIDYEGQLPDILGHLLTIARDTGILKKLYLMIDQLEDLFGPSYSELRQSRMVTDMRQLIDKQDAGVPIGLVFAWSPDVDLLGYTTREFVDRQMQNSYGALYTRLSRRLVTIQKLRELHAPGFAEAYMEPLRSKSGNDPTKWPKPIELAGEAWGQLGKRGLVQDNTVTPRDLLTALAESTNVRADAAQNQSK